MATASFGLLYVVNGTRALKQKWNRNLFFRWKEFNVRLMVTNFKAMCIGSGWEFWLWKMRLNYFYSDIISNETFISSWDVNVVAIISVRTFIGFSPVIIVFIFTYDHINANPI